MISADTASIQALIAGASSENIEQVETLSNAYIANTVAGDAYQNMLDSLRNGIADATLSFDDFFVTLGMSELEVLNRNIDIATEDLGLVGVTVSNFTTLLSSATSENLQDYTQLGQMLQQRYRLEQEDASALMDEQRRNADELYALETRTNKERLRALEVLANKVQGISKDFDIP